MNLYLIGLNISGDHNTIRDKFIKMKDIYPLIDENTLNSYVDTWGFVYSMSHCEQSITPREYYFSDEQNIIFYSGLPVHMNSSFTAHKSKNLLQNWKGLENYLDGQFSVFKIDKKRFTCEVITDLMGVEQVYYYNKNGKILISNSIRLIERVVGFNGYDIKGICSFLNLGYYSHKTTYNSDVKVMEGGIHWHYEYPDNKIIIKKYFNPLELSINKKGNLNKKKLFEIAEKVGDTLVNLDKDFNELTVPLTAGKDSRLIAGVLRERNINATYYTNGEMSNKDVWVAAEISKIYGFNHSIKKINENLLVQNWDTLVKNLIEKNDSMVALWQLVDYFKINDDPDKLELRLPGHGVGLINPDYQIRADYYKRITFERVLKNNLSVLDAPKDIYNSRTYNIGEELIRNSIKQYFDLGIKNENVYHLFDKLQWYSGCIGITQRKMQHVGDDYYLFYNRHLLNYAFTLKDSNLVNFRISKILLNKLLPEIKNNKRYKNIEGFENPHLYRITESLKYNTKQVLNNIKFIQSLISKINSRNSGGYEKKVNSAIDKSVIDKIRSVCLDNEKAIFWELVNKKRFEEVLSDKCDVTTLNAYIPYIYRAANLFYHEQFRD